MTDPRALPAVADLERWFSYDASTGVLRWRERSDRLRNWNARYAGQPVGSRDPDGYLYTGHGATRYAVHRIIWKLMTGADPEGDIDHRDGDGGNNRWANLRDVSRSQNQQNSRSRGEWPKGVYCNRRGKFVGQIKLDGRTVYLGQHTTPGAAHQAYAEQARRHFGEFACLDR